MDGEYSDGVCGDRPETVLHQHQHGTLVGRMVNQQGADNKHQRLGEIHFRKSEKSSSENIRCSRYLFKGKARPEAAGGYTSSTPPSLPQLDPGNL